MELEKLEVDLKPLIILRARKTEALFLKGAVPAGRSGLKLVYNISTYQGSGSPAIASLPHRKISKKERKTDSHVSF